MATIAPQTDNTTDHTEEPLESVLQRAAAGNPDPRVSEGLSLMLATIGLERSMLAALDAMERAHPTGYPVPSSVPVRTLDESEPAEAYFR